MTLRPRNDWPWSRRPVQGPSAPTRPSGSRRRGRRQGHSHARILIRQHAGLGSKMRRMRIGSRSLACAGGAAGAHAPPAGFVPTIAQSAAGFSLDEVFGFPFPSADGGGAAPRLAWAVNEQAVATSGWPSAAVRARQLTSYAVDDGQELTSIDSRRRETSGLRAGRRSRVQLGRQPAGEPVARRSRRRCRSGRRGSRAESRDSSPTATSQ